MSLIEYKEFYRRHCVRTPAQLANPKLSQPQEIYLPKGSMIHYIAETDSQVGIDASYCLLRNYESKVSIHHLDKMEIVKGRATYSTAAFNAKRKAFHKNNRNFYNAKDLTRATSNDRIPVVLNYGILPHLYKYTQNMMMGYHQWFNVRAKFWEQIAEIGSDRVHFIRMKMPRYLPNRNEFDLHKGKFSTKSFGVFNDAEELDLLDLWKALSEDIDHPAKNLPHSVAVKVHLVMVESGQVSILRLSDILSWAQEDNKPFMLRFYKYLDFTLGLRSAADTEIDYEDIDIDLDKEPDYGSETIGRLIRERGDVGQLSASEQKGLVTLSKRMEKVDNPFGDGTIMEKITSKPDIEVKEVQVVSDSDTIFDKGLLQSSIQQLDQDYIEKLHHKNILSMIAQSQEAGVIVKDIKVKAENTAVTKAEIISVSFQPVGGKASTIKFKIPKINKNGTFLAGGVKYRLERQKGDMPITKIKSYMVGLTSYYGKVFVTRNQNAVTNFSRWFSKQINKRLEDPENNTLVNVIHGANEFSDIKLPRTYTAIAEYHSEIVTKQYQFYFNYSVVDAYFNEDVIKSLKKKDMVPVGFDRASKAVLAMDFSGAIFKDKEPLGFITSLIDETMGRGPIEYSETSVFSKRIPTILALSYFLGIDKALAAIGAKFYTSPPNVRLNLTPSDYRIKFKDESFIVDIRDPEVAMLVGGFNAVRKHTANYNSNDLNKPQTYVTLMSKNGINQYHLRELKLMFDMFVDPITRDILESEKEPTSFAGLLIRANELLVTDEVPRVEPMRIKGYERISGMVYKEIITSMRGLRNRGNSPDAEVSMNPNAIWLSILQDESVALVEDSTPIHNLKEKEAVTSVGQGGRSSRTMTREARGFTENDLGVISEASPDSSKVGVRTFTSADPNIVDLYGRTRPYDPKVDGSSAKHLSTSALLLPAANHNAAKRLNFVSIQNSSSVSVDGQMSMPFRTGKEQVLSGQVDDIFASVAEKDGKVVSVKDKYIEVEYTDGSKEAFELGTKYGVASGTTVPHPIVTHLKVGDKFKAKDAICYDSGFFEPDLANPGKVTYMSGVLARVALKENANTIEDSCIITKDFAKRLNTQTAYTKNLIVDFDQNIHNLVKVGDAVDPETILCVLENSVISEFTGDDKAAADSLRKIDSSSPKARNKGTVASIETIYYGSLDDMSASLRKVCEASDRRRATRAKQLGVDDARTGKVDDKVQVEGKKLSPNQVAIKIILDSSISMGTGDKLVFDGMLKATCGNVYEEPIISVDDGDTVDAIFGHKPISDRIVGGPEINAVANAALYELSKQMVAIYFGE